MAGLLSTLIKEVSFRIEMKPTERGIASQNAEKKNEYLSYPIHRKVWGLRKDNRKNVRTRSCVVVPCNAVFWLWHGSHKYELTAVMTSCTTSLLGQATLTLGSDWELTSRPHGLLRCYSSWYLLGRRRTLFWRDGHWIYMFQEISLQPQKEKKY